MVGIVSNAMGLQNYLHGVQIPFTPNNFFIWLEVAEWLKHWFAKPGGIE